MSRRASRGETLRADRRPVLSYPAIIHVCANVEARAIGPRAVAFKQPAISRGYTTGSPRGAGVSPERSPAHARRTSVSAHRPRAALDVRVCAPRVCCAHESYLDREEGAEDPEKVWGRWASGNLGALGLEVLSFSTRRLAPGVHELEMHDIISTSYVLLEAGSAYRVRVRKRSEQPLGELLAGKGCGVPVLQLEIEYQYCLLSGCARGMWGTHSRAGETTHRGELARRWRRHMTPLAALWFVCACVQVACELHLVASG